jgi:archaellum component FlaC
MFFPLYFAQCALSPSCGRSDETPSADDATEHTLSAGERYLVIVAREHQSLHDYLKRRFSADPKVDVILDRRETERRDSVGMRRPAREQTERRRHQAFKRDLRFHAVVVTPCHASAASVPAAERDQPKCPEGQGSTSMGDVDVAEERQRVTRWIEESQYLIGRIVPGLLDDRDRLRSRAEGAEQEADRLRQEVHELRKEIADLQSEKEFVRNEQVTMTEAFGKVMEHLSQMHEPLNEVMRRLRSSQSLEFNSATS